MNTKTRDQVMAALEAFERDWLQTGTVSGPTADKLLAVLVVVQAEAGKA